MMQLDISSQVPLHGQEDWNFCGGACAQMTLEGNPNPNHRLTKSQNELMDVIADYNRNQPNGPQWATSPDGMEGCLNHQSQDSTEWEIGAVKTRHEALRLVVKGMDSYRFPTPVLIDEGAHWVLIVGWEVHGTLEDDNLSLQHINYYDPLPEDVGSQTLVAGSFWNEHHWNEPVAPQGQWQGKYVVVGKTECEAR